MFKKYFFAGLLIWLPILATVFVIHVILNVLDSIIDLLPAAYQPADFLGVNVPGMGILLSLCIILVTGLLAGNFLGKKLLKWGERLVSKIPFVRTIYSGTKQILETLLSSQGESFRKVLLVEYPRKGMWSIAFQSSSGHPAVNAKAGKTMIAVFIPTTPNPTSGFLLLVPIDEVIELNIPVEEALKFVVSLGTIHR